MSLDQAQADAALDLSIIVAMHNEQEVIEEFFGRLLPVLQQLTQSYEIVCINDGSTDDTFSRLLTLAKRDPHFRVIDFSRNFGKEAALSAGLLHVRGDATVLIDADLQDPPELIPQFYALWKQGYDVVSGVRVQRTSDTNTKRLTARWFYRAFNLLSDVQIPPDAGDFRLLSRTVVNAINTLPERRRFMKGIYSWVGFKQASVGYERSPRAAGATSWSYWKLWNLAMDGVTSFTTLPLRLWTYLGVVVFLLSLGLTLFFLVTYVLGRVPLPGFYWLALLILFFGALQMVTMGILGEYLGRIYEETKMRPLYIIREKFGFDDSGAPPDLPTMIPGDSSTVVASVEDPGLYDQQSNKP